MHSPTSQVCVCERVGRMNGKSLKRVTALLALLASAYTALVLTVLPVRAADPTLQVDPMDNPLTISRMLTNSTTTFGGNIRLTAIGGDISNLRLLASDLQMMNNACLSTPSPQSTPTSQSASTMIDRSNISIPAGTLLKDIQPTDVLVTITNVIHPGTYCGFLDFYNGQIGTKLLTVPLTLRISASPNVTSLDDTVTVQVVHSQWPEIFDNFLVNIVLSNSYEQDNWTVRLLNETLVPVNILGMTLDLKGDKTGVDYSDAFPNVQFPLSLPANQTKPINFMINRELPPDHYHGMIRLILENSDAAVKVPVDVNLRNGPLWPIALLILGILLGQLAISLYSPTATRQNALRERAKDLYTELGQLQDPASATDIMVKLEDIKDKIYVTYKEDELTALGNKLEKLEARISFYRKLDVIEERINQQVKDDLKRGELLALVKEVRRSMRGVEVDEIPTDPENQLKKLEKQWLDWLDEQEKKIRALATFTQMYDLSTIRTTKDESILLLDSAKSRLDRISSTSEKISQVKTTENGHKQGRRRILQAIKQFFQKLWAKLWRTQAQRAELRDVWIRPLIKLILVIVLAVIGLQTFYLTNATFGASGLSDYLPLFLWGFGANVAGSTFQNLPLPSSRG